MENNISLRVLFRARSRSLSKTSSLTSFTFTPKTVDQEESDVKIIVPVGYREGDNIRGLYGRILIDTVSVDILADVELRYRGKWLYITYENLTPCTIEVTLIW